jgi:hypothetical protein
VLWLEVGASREDGVFGAHPAEILKVPTIGRGMRSIHGLPPRTGQLYFMQNSSAFNGHGLDGPLPWRRVALSMRSAQRGAQDRRWQGTEGTAAHRWPDGGPGTTAASWRHVAPPRPAARRRPVPEMGRAWNQVLDRRGQPTRYQTRPDRAAGTRQEGEAGGPLPCPPGGLAEAKEGRRGGSASVPNSARRGGKPSQPATWPA